MMRYRWVGAMAGVLAAAVVAMPANAQDDMTARLERQLRQAEQEYQLRANPALNLTERMLLEYGGTASFAFMAVDDTGQRTHILRQTDVQLFGQLSLDGVHDFYGRLRYTYRDFNAGQSFDGAGDESSYPLADRFWYRFNLRRAIEAYEGQHSDLNVIMQAGRQYVQWGSGLTLSDQLYAVRGTVEYKPFEFEGLLSTTPESSFVDFDSSRPSFDGETNRSFTGGKLTFTGLKEQRPYVFVLDQQDHNRENQAVIAAIPTQFDYNSTYWGIGSTGLVLPRLLYTVEWVWESGRGLSDSIRAPQRREVIEAWAAIANLTYLCGDQNLSKLEFETILASGDDDRLLDTSNTFGGNQRGSKDRAFNAFGLEKTGMAFGAPISNLMLFRVGGSTFPLRGQDLFKRFQVGLDVLAINKLDQNAPINEESTSNHFLGMETDLYTNWRITSDVAWTVRYGVFFPGEGIAADKDERHFVYTGVSYSF